LLAKPQMVFVARETQKKLRGIHEIGKSCGELNHVFTFWIQIKSVLVPHLPPSPFSIPTSLRPRHFDLHSHLFLADFGSGNAELRTI
jgi:hypothetical protein